MIQLDVMGARWAQTFRLWAVLLCSICLVVGGLTGCGKKGTGGMGPGTEITGEGETQDPGGTGSKLPGAGEGSGDDTADGPRGDRIEDIFFEYDRYEIRADGRRVLQENVRYLMKNSTQRVVLEGHCDDRGTNEYNLALGQRRADAVLQYLVELGVNAARLSTISYGEEKPFAFESSEAARAENRRVHFSLR